MKEIREEGNPMIADVNEIVVTIRKQRKKIRKRFKNLLYLDSVRWLFIYHIFIEKTAEKWCKF